MLKLKDHIMSAMIPKPRAAGACHSRLCDAHAESLRLSSNWNIIGA